MDQELKKRVLRANLFLKEEQLIKLTWGNVSEIDRQKGIVAIKPSGVDYSEMSISDIVIVDLNGNVLEGELKPSSDLKTHLEIYKAFPEIGGITHTHSPYATSFAQAKKAITFYGTTHADHFHGDIPLMRDLSDAEIIGDYEKNTGLVIVESLIKQNINPMHIPAVLVPSHGPFSFGNNASDSAKNALVLEEVAKMALLTESINYQIKRASDVIGDKHFNRKHGENSYYGQNKGGNYE